MSEFLTHGPDGSEFLIMNRLGPPKAPPGYVAVFIDGRWEIIPNSGRFTVGDQSTSQRLFSSETTVDKGSYSFQQGPGNGDGIGPGPGPGPGTGP
jgi:hypothetical protein